MPQRTGILTAACSAVQCWYKGRTPRDLARVEAHRGAGSRHPGIVTPPCVLKSPLNNAIWQPRSTTITRASIISHFIFTTADYHVVLVLSQISRTVRQTRGRNSAYPASE
jgi:hypothetical protein